MTAQTLKPGEFRAVCQKGHELESFTDRAAFEAHMKGTHKVSKAVGTTLTKARPYPWKAPKAPEDMSGLAAVLVAAGGDVTDVAGLPGFVTEGVFRYDNGTEPPLESLPANVRPIVAGAVARGDMWLVHLDGASARIEVARKVEVNGAKVTEAARVELHGGKVQKVYTVKRDDTGRWRDAKITEAKRLFPAA